MAINNISANGSIVTLQASSTFPFGFVFTAFSDDTDPYDAPSLKIADAAKDINGNLITWSNANPLKWSVSVSPGSPEANNLAILFDANTPSANRIPARDIITVNLLYPNGSFTTFSEGIITDGVPAKSAASAGRLKTLTYAFSFTDKAGV